VRLSGDPSRRVWIFLPARPFDQAEIVGVDSPPWGVLAADERAALVLRPEQTLSTRIRRGLGLAPSGPDEIANEATTYEATGETRTEDGRLLREYVFTGTPNGAPVVAAIQAARRRPVEVRLAEVEAAPTPVTVPADGRPRVVAKDDALGVLFVRAADPMPALRQDVSFRRPGGGWVMGWVAVAGTTAYAVAAFPGQRWDDVTVGDEAVFRD
jgi:hypothetical protein